MFHRRYLRYIFISLPAIAAVVVGFVVKLEKEERQRSFIENGSSSEGIEEDRGGRKAFEKLRHQNPATGRIPAHARAGEMQWINRLTNVSGRVSDNIQTQEWKCIGPYNLGGRTKALAVDVSDPLQRTILAGCVSGGMWRSENLGSTWTKTSEAFQLQSVSCVAQDTREGREQTWYYGTGEMFDASDPDNDNGLVRGNGIFKSTDGGRSWHALASTQNGFEHAYDNAFDYVWDIVVDASNTGEDEIYAATINGIFRSVDGGDTWKNVLGVAGNAGRYTDIAITSHGEVWAAVSNMDGSGSVAGIFRSMDGMHWERADPSWWPRRFNRITLAIAPSNEKKIFVLADLSANERKKHLLCVYEEDVGWKDLSDNLPDFEYDLGDYDSQLSFAMVLAVEPDNENIVFLGGVNLYRSVDAFTSKENTAWIGGYDPQHTDRSKYPRHHPDQHSLAFFKDPGRMLSGHDGGISLLHYSLQPTAAWQSLNAGYVTSQFYTAALNQASADNVVIGGMQDNGSFMGVGTKPQSAWSSLLAGDGSFCAVSNNGDHYYVSSQYGRVYRLDYDRQSYKGFARIDPPEALDYLFVNPFALDPYNANILYMAGGSCLWRNHNVSRIARGSDEPTSQFWTRLDGTCAEGNISAIAVSTSPQNVLYYGTSAGKVFRVDKANSDQPRVTEITATIFPKYFGKPTGYVSSIAVDPFDAQHIMVSFSNYEILSVFVSNDGGERWSCVAGNLETRSDGTGAGPVVYSCAMLHCSQETVYFLGTSTGLCYTTSLSAMQTQWQWEPSVGNVPVEMVICRQKDGRVLAATHGYGVHTTQFQDAVVPATDPLLLTLGQGYPNPVHRGEVVSIPLRLDEDRYIDLRLYDASGKFVASVVKKEMPHGDHTIEFHTGGLEPGQYLYRLGSGNRSMTKRMIVN